MSDVAIRRATPADAERLSAIGGLTFTQTFGHLYAARDLAEYLAEAHGVSRAQADLTDPTMAAWLVEKGDDVVGYALAGPCGLPHPDVTRSSGELHRIYFRTGFQGSGLGGRLFAEVMDWLERDGPRDIWIGVWSENFGARKFYARHGFEEVGEYGFRVGATVDREFILRRAIRA